MDSAPVADREPDELTLAGEFGAPGHADWQELVAGVLRKTGALPADFHGDPASLLTTRTYDGIEIQPLYTAADTAPEAGFPGLAPYVRGADPEANAAVGWQLRQLHADPDPAATNKAVLADLECGAGSSWLRVGEHALPIDRLADALNGVYPELAPVVLDAGAEYAAATEALLAVFAEHGVPAGDVVGSAGADPIGLRARSGRPHDVAAAARFGARLTAEYPRLRTFVADGLPYHEAGGSDAQELGAAIATGVAYLRALADAGLDVDAAAALVEFRLAATADQFLTIAKFRAARRLWARVTEVSGARAHGMRQHAVTSPAMLTLRDPWVNMLRCTIACFGAAVGGADAITVLPFDSRAGLPDAFARRIARNTSSILLEESKIAGVIDPAGGSWYVENLTDEFARAAWREFTEIEREGGIESTLDSGALAGRLAATWAERSGKIANRTDPITGVSEFPNLGEDRLRRRAAPDDPAASGGLPRVHYAQAYENLRDRSDAHLDARGERPRVFLATLGPVAAHTGRASFAANLFSAGGIEPVNPGATAGTDELIAAFRDSGAGVACLCGSDAAYAEQAAAVAAALDQVGAKAVLLAGKPGDGYPGVTGFVHTGCDGVALLESTLETLGVE